jgi:hypothetical protein
MKKQILLFLMMLLPSMANAYDALIDGVFYNFDKSTKTATVTCERITSDHSGINNTSSGNIIIPSEVKYNNVTYRVTKIGMCAFETCEGLKSITIPGSVSVIDNWAFTRCKNLTSVTIHNGVKFIGESVFRDCSSLTSITIPNSVLDIGVWSFSNTAWSNNQPDGPLYLDNCLLGFKGSEPSGSFEIKEGTRLIVTGAYCGDYLGRCDLTSITIPSSVEHVGKSSFPSAWLDSQPEGLLFIGKVAYRYIGFMPENTEIVLPEGTTEIGWGAFANCDNSMTSLTIPSSVTYIGENALQYCGGLKSITIESSNPVYDSRNNCNAIIETESGGLIKGCNNAFIPEGVATIEKEAFYGCKGLTSFTIPNGVKSIGGRAFYGCTNLKSVTIPSSVTFIGSGAFQHCNVTSFFSDSKEPSKIESWTVAGYSIGTLSDATLYVPKGCVNVYAQATGWNKFKEIKEMIKVGSFTYSIKDDNTAIVIDVTDPGQKEISIPASITVDGKTYPVKAIAENGFIDNKVLERVTIPESVTEIGAYAFSGCSNLASVSVPESISMVGIGVFSDTPWYDNLPDGVVYIGKVACEYKGDISDDTKIEFKDGTLAIRQEAFSCRWGIVSVTIPNSVTYIGEKAFQHLHLTSVNIPNSVTYIGEEAFSTYSLSSLTVDSENPKYDSRNNCNAIIETATNTLILGCKNTVIPNSVTSIGDRAFENCEDLISILIPNSVTSIGESSFAGCRSLTSLSIPEGVVSIGINAFSDCQSLKTVSIPSSVTSLGSYAFVYCYSLESVKVKNLEPLQIGMSSFFNNCVLYVPKGSAEVYANAIGWSSFREIKEFVNDEVASYTIEEEKGASVIDTSEPTTKDVEIPNSITVDDKTYPVKAIADNAFVGNTVIKKVSIPESVEEIGASAFQGCKDLNTIYCYTEEPIALGSAEAAAARTRVDGEGKASSVFDGVDKVTCLLYVPAASIDKYKAADGWKDFKYIVGIGSNFIIGNVNGDDMLDNRDLQAIINHVMDKPQEGAFDENMADVNLDGHVDVNDVVFLVKLLGQK